MIQDIRYAIRGLRKNPVFVSTAILTLALAIGGNTAIFTVIHTVLLNPLRYQTPDQLVRLSGAATPARFSEMSAAAQSFSGLGAFTRQDSLTLSGVNEPADLSGVHVSANFLQILGVTPLRGRGFLPAEDVPGGAPVALISAELWQRSFGRDPHIVGKTAIFNTTSFIIVGVLPPRFEFPSPGLDVWLPAPSDSPAMPASSRALSPFLTVFGRLKSGVSLAQANAEMKVIRRQYATNHPGMLDSKPKSSVEVTPMKEELVRNVRSMLWMLFGALGFVLMIACANLASLLLVRAASRQQEFALRSALGAARGRLIRQLLAESILLSTLGGAVGVLLAALCTAAIPQITSFELPRQTEIHMDGTVLAFAAALSIATGLLFGLAPSLRSSAPDLMRVLRAGETPGKPASARLPALLSLRSLLSIAQVALSIVLLTGAALLLESLNHLRHVPVGFNPSKLLTVTISLPPLRYDTDQKASTFFRELCRRFSTTPGVRSAAVAMSLPMMDYPGIPVQDAARPKLPLNERLIAKFFPVSPNYFRTLQIPLKRGREFAEQDRHETQRVAIINETLARHLWPTYPGGLNPIGQRLWVGGINPKPAEIVGIVSDAKQNLDDHEDWQDSVYVSFEQSPVPLATLAIRTAGDPLAFSSALRDQVRRLDRDQPIGLTQTMEERMEAQVGQRRLLGTLLGLFAFVALALSLIGIYGVIAYSVAQRMREFAIRQALGAHRGDLLGLVLRQGLVLALAGIVIGVCFAIGLTRLIRTLLFDVSATDPATFFSVALLFFIVALAASYIPARRAASLDPIEALRRE